MRLPVYYLTYFLATFDEQPLLRKKEGKYFYAFSARFSPDHTRSN